jgi:protein involved in polysaccharide export with SLBB domain
MRPDGEGLTTRYFDANTLMAGKGNVLLEPGDRIIVRRAVDERGDYRVTLAGELKFPGVYPITRNGTRLSQVIRQAGGFTETASLSRAELIRRTVQPSELALEKLESLRGGVQPDDSSYYYLETNLRIQKEIVNVNFQDLFENRDSTQDVFLRNEDYIYVPPVQRTIYVFGQVVSPGNVTFLPGRDVEYYVQQAGGLTERARESDIKIVKAKTRQWLSPDESRIEEGDYVWVPKDPERPFSYYMTVISQGAAILSVLLGIAVVIVQSYK